MYARPFDALLNALNFYLKICKLALINHKRINMCLPRRFVFSHFHFFDFLSVPSENLFVFEFKTKTVKFDAKTLKTLKIHKKIFQINLQA